MDNRKDIISYVTNEIKTTKDAKKFLSRTSVDLKEYYDMDWLEDCFDYLWFVKQFVSEVASDSRVKTTMDAINSFYYWKKYA